MVYRVKTKVMKKLLLVILFGFSFGALAQSEIPGDSLRMMEIIDSVLTNNPDLIDKDDHVYSLKALTRFVDSINRFLTSQSPDLNFTIDGINTYAGSNANNETGINKTIVGGNAANGATLGDQEIIIGVRNRQSDETPGDWVNPAGGRSQLPAGVGLDLDSVSKNNLSIGNYISADFSYSIAEGHYIGSNAILSGGTKARLDHTIVRGNEALLSGSQGSPRVYGSIIDGHRAAEITNWVNFSLLYGHDQHAEGGATLDSVIAIGHAYQTNESTHSKNIIHVGHGINSGSYDPDTAKNEITIGNGVTPNGPNTITLGPPAGWEIKNATLAADQIIGEISLTNVGPGLLLDRSGSREMQFNVGYNNWTVTADYWDGSNNDAAYLEVTQNGLNFQYADATDDGVNILNIAGDQFQFQGDHGISYTEIGAAWPSPANRYGFYYTGDYSGWLTDEPRNIPDVGTVAMMISDSIDGLSGGGGSDGVVSNVVLSGTDLNFTGSDGGFNGTVDLSTLSGGGSVDTNHLVNPTNLKTGTWSTTTGGNTIGLNMMQTPVHRTILYTDDGAAGYGYMGAFANSMQIGFENGAIANYFTVHKSGLVGIEVSSTQEIGWSGDGVEIAITGTKPMFYGGDYSTNILTNPQHIPDVGTVAMMISDSIDGLSGGGGSDGVVSNVVLSGTDLNFTGSDGGFNGTVDLSTLSGGGSDGVVTGVDLIGNILSFTGTNGGFNDTVDLENIRKGDSSWVSMRTNSISSHDASSDVQIIDDFGVMGVVTLEGDFIHDALFLDDSDRSIHARNVELGTVSKTVVPADWGKEYIINSSETFTFGESSDTGLEIGDKITFIRADAATVTLETTGSMTIEFSDNTNSSSFTINESGTLYYKGNNDLLFIGD
jgi:hypothetical protein